LNQGFGPPREGRSKQWRIGRKSSHQPPTTGGIELKRLLQVAAISLAASGPALDAQAQTRGPDLIKDLTEKCAKLEERRAKIREIEYEISIAELYVELYTNMREKLVREGRDRQELGGRSVTTIEFENAIDGKRSWESRLSEAKIRHLWAVGFEESAVREKEEAQTRLTDAVGEVPLLDPRVRDVVIDDEAAEKIKKSLDELGEQLEALGGGESQPSEPGSPGFSVPPEYTALPELSTEFTTVSRDRFLDDMGEDLDSTFGSVPEECELVTVIRIGLPFLHSSGEAGDPPADLAQEGNCLASTTTDPATGSRVVEGPFVLDTDEAKRLARELAERARKLREAEESARMEREKAQLAQTLFGDAPPAEMTYGGPLFVARVTGFGAWDSMPPARLGSRDFNTLSPEGNDMSDREEMERFGGRIFLGVAPWLSDPWVYPTGWRGGISLELAKGNGDGGRTFTTPAGTMPTIVSLDGTGIYALNNQTTFDRDIDSTGAGFHGKIGNTFGLPEGIGLTPYVAVEGAWSRTEANTTIRTSGPGVFNGFLNEDITALRLGILLGLEAAIPIFDGLFLTLGAVGGVAQHWINYEGNDCGSTDATGGPCNGGFFRTNVEQNKTFTGFTGTGSAGLEWFIPCGGGRHCASLLFKASAGRETNPEFDYPSNVSRLIEVKSSSDPSYGVTGSLTVPLDFGN